jgi:hypothetical protein
LVCTSPVGMRSFTGFAGSDVVEYNSGRLSVESR